METAIPANQPLPSHSLRAECPPPVPSTAPDPFWNTAPANPLVSATTLAAKQPSHSSASQVRPARSPGPGSRRPQCTHTTVDRVHFPRHSHATCWICGKPPSLGWLYVCRQDQEPVCVPHILDLGDCEDVVDYDDMTSLRLYLADLVGMSQSVVDGIYEGLYAADQFKLLIEQKRHCIATICRQEARGMGAVAPPVRTTNKTTMSPVEGVIASVDVTAGPSVRARTEHAMQSSKGVLPLTCNLQVCHTCRPFFQDRLYMSFEKAFSGAVPAITDAEITCLPILDAAVLRSIGGRYRMPSAHPSPKRPDSVDITLEPADGVDEDTSNWTPTSATISESNSDQLDDDDPYPCPGAGHCSVWSGRSGCAYDRGFDDGLRAMNHGFGPTPSADFTRITPDNSCAHLRRIRGSVSDSTASSISLPTPSTAPLTPLISVERPFEDVLESCITRPGKAASIAGPFVDHRRLSCRSPVSLHSKSSRSSLGVEVEVVGGVALTEEAVGAGIPDILTADD